jgi:hypothetical protein
MAQERISIFFPATVRERVLDQHEVLRELLRQALDTTTRGLQHDGPGRDELSRLAHDLRGRFRAHLAFEEQALAPVLANMDAWGPERVQDLLEEHGRQRAELDTLLEGVRGDWDTPRLSLALRSLVTDLLLDMAEEERGCLAAAALQDQMLIVGTVRE